MPKVPRCWATTGFSRFDGNGGQFGAFLDERGILDRVADDLPEWCEFVRSRLPERQDVPDLDVAGDEHIRNQPPMALPPLGFRAHDRHLPACAEANEPVQSNPEFRCPHVICVAAERRIEPAAIR